MYTYLLGYFTVSRFSISVLNTVELLTFKTLTGRFYSILVYFILRNLDHVLLNILFTFIKTAIESYSGKKVFLKSIEYTENTSEIPVKELIF